eukprot:GEMP01136746.1.p1 GENE.GEMP01136746.1~~GEMP01136746.1.p1  ORF type:complete len:136 (+),score=6.49 GEMP01136746.1:54-410(+)
MGGALSTLWNKPIQDAAAVSETGPRVVEMSNRALVADFIVTAEGLRKIRDRNVMSFYKFDAEAGKSLIRSCEGDLCVQDFSSSVYNLYSDIQDRWKVRVYCMAPVFIVFNCRQTMNGG